MAADLTTAVQYLTINRLVDWTGETTLENPLPLTLQDQDGSQIQLLVGQLTQEEDERLIAQADEPQLIYAAPADELEPVLAATDQSLLADQETAQDETAEDETAGEETAGEEESNAQDGTGGQAASNQDEAAGAQAEAEGGTAGGETVQQDAVSE